MGLPLSRTFRGSAAFFAMLLAASSGAGAELTGTDNMASDHVHPASPSAIGGRGLSVVAASKFTRRRPPLARRMIENAQRG
jgi:hypothetical protein